MCLVKPSDYSTVLQLITDIFLNEEPVFKALRIENDTVMRKYLNELWSENLKEGKTQEIYFLPPPEGHLYFLYYIFRQSVYNILPVLFTIPIKLLTI